MEAERLHSDIWSQLRDDPISTEHLNNQSDPKWTLDPDGLLCHLGCIYVPNSSNLRLCVLQYLHNHPLAGHFGQTKTLYQVSMHYYWSGLPVYIKDYCKSCTICSHAKPVRHRPYRLLKQLPIPKKPWNSISMDFIEKLPQSSGYTSILVIVDRLSKQSLFILTHDTITSQQLAQLFVLLVFSKHGVPSHVTSDRGMEFVSHFFRSLGTALDMKLHFTSRYHPEGDGQTEQTNQTLEQYLRVYCNYQQDNWSELLPLAEFTYNNTPSATTSITPFLANKGYHPNLTVNPEHDLTSAHAHDFVTNLDELHQELRQHIAEAQRQYQAPADSRRLPAPEFKIGSHTYVKAQLFHTTRLSKKLSDKFLGPYAILARPGTHSVTLRLPDSLRPVHPVFHISVLGPATPNPIPDRIQPPPPPITVDDEPEFEISEILDTKIDNRRRACKLLYLVRWTGYEGTDEETSWILVSELRHASELVSDFHLAYPAKPGPLLSLH